MRRGTNPYSSLDVRQLGPLATVTSKHLEDRNEHSEEVVHMRAVVDSFEHGIVNRGDRKYHGSVWSTLMNILLVDDYRATTEVLADVARSMGHAVSQAYSGVEALVVTTGEGPFDLILLDIALPDISGHEVCLRLRASERYASRRIVSLSAHVDLCDHFDMSCFDGHLLKPLALSEFESLLSDRNEAYRPLQSVVK
jgi:two-component system, OmpR family, response regulator